MLTIGHSLHASDSNVQRAMASGDRAWIGALARRQILAGVDMIDLNASAFAEREAEVLLWCAQVVEAMIDRPLVLDSADETTLLEVAAGCRHAPWLNSLEVAQVWPDALELQLARGAHWIVQLREGERIPVAAADRLELCERALTRAAARGFPRPWIDAVALPWGRDFESGRGLLDFLEESRRRWPGLQVLVGLSNISYGSPRRAEIHRLWLPELKRRGLAGLLMDPFDPALIEAAR